MHVSHISHAGTQNMSGGGERTPLLNLNLSLNDFLPRLTSKLKNIKMCEHISVYLRFIYVFKIH